MVQCAAVTLQGETEGGGRMLSFSVCNMNTKYRAHSNRDLVSLRALALCQNTTAIMPKEEEPFLLSAAV